MTDWGTTDARRSLTDADTRGDHAGLSQLPAHRDRCRSPPALNRTLVHSTGRPPKRLRTCVASIHRSLVCLQQRWNLVMPGEARFYAAAADRPHGGPALRVIEELAELAGEVDGVVRARICGGFRCRISPFGEVEL